MLEIGIALSNNAEAYLEFLMWTVSRTASGRIRYVLGVNHGADIDVVKRIVEGYDADVFDARVDGGYGSLNHGMCLDLIFQRMTGPAGMLVDCDVAFLEPGWDSLMLAKLNERVIIVGSEYDGAKYRGFPNVIGALMDVHAVKALDISFRPEGVTTISDESLIVYGYPPGEPQNIILDTGSELPRKIKAAGFQGIHMPLYRAGHPGAKFMTADIRGEEYQLEGVPLFTHLGRSYTRPFGSADAVAWELRVRDYLNA